MKTKTCTYCGEKKPLDAEHWRRNKHSPDGFQPQCKPCSQEAVRVHYRKWFRRDVTYRGLVGCKCLLWSMKCGVCPLDDEEDFESCWRVQDIPFEDEGYPIAIGQ